MSENSDIELCSGMYFFTVLMIFLSAKMEGFGIDFSSHFANIVASIFFTDSEALRITSSVGFERSNDSSLDFISES